MRFLTTIFLICGVMFLSACGEGHEKAYLTKGAQVQSLKVPSGVPPVKQETYLVVPTVAKPTSSQIASLQPPTMFGK